MYPDIEVFILKIQGYHIIEEQLKMIEEKTAKAVREAIEQEEEAERAKEELMRAQRSRAKAQSQQIIKQSTYVLPSPSSNQLLSPKKKLEEESRKQIQAMGTFTNKSPNKRQESRKSLLSISRPTTPKEREVSV